MATTEDFQEQFLTCAICSDVYTDPATLACQHTFCRECLTQFTQTRPDAIKDKSIPCPFCRRHTKVPQPNKPVQQWAKQIEAGFLVQSLMDAFGPRADDIILCDVCTKKGKGVPAPSWCSECSAAYCDDCLISHDFMRMSADHRIETISNRCGVIRKKQNIFCQMHKEVVKIFCKDCDRAICNTCNSIDHRTCKNVVTVQSMTDSMKSLLRETKRRIQERVEKEEERLRIPLTHIDALSNSAEEAKEEIKKTCKKAVDLIHQRETDLLKEVDEIASKSLEKLSEESRSNQMSVKISQQNIVFIDQALKSDSDSHLYEMYQSCKSENFASDPYPVTKSSKGNIVKISLKNNGDGKHLRNTLSSMLTVNGVHGGPTDHVSVPYLLQSIDIEDSELGTPNPTDIVVFPADNGCKTLVIADNSNKCLVMVSTELGGMRSHLYIGEAPWSLCKMNPHRVVSTILEEKKLVVANVQFPNLTLHSEVRTQKVYSGIASLDSESLVVGSLSPTSIDIIDLEGNVLKTIANQTTIRAPHFLSVTPNREIVVSDSGSKAIVCMTEGGDIVFWYRPERRCALRAPRGIVTDAAGGIVFVDRDSNKVTHLTANGEFVRHILTSKDCVTKPCGVCIDEHSCLFVTERGRGVKEYGF
ncbi:tripartite motif-containing protein 2-like isoform X2 [Haliotis asinina]